MTIVATTSLLCPKNEHQQSVKDFWLSIIANASTVPRHEAITKLLAAFIGENNRDIIANMFSK
jgi:hypothetical protein